MMDERLRRIAETIQQDGGQAFLVGGYVRDRLLGRESKDADIEVYGLEADRLEQLLAAWGEVIRVGKAYGVYRVKGLAADFALPRRERKTGPGHRDFAVSVAPDLPFLVAGKRRDFTINSILQDILTGGIIDLFSGRSDLRQGIIRHVDPVTFGEDPLRVYRAAQFAARFEFTVHPETIDLCRQVDLSALSKERILGEMEKILLLAPRPSVGLRCLQAMGVLARMHPLLAALPGCPQNPVFHPEGDVWEHTLRVVDEAAKLRDRTTRLRVLMWAALLHDLGKPCTTVVTEGNLTSRGHDVAGEKLSREFLATLTAEKELPQQVASLIKEHMVPFFLYSRRREITDAALRRLADRVDLPVLLLLAQADYLGKGRPRDFTPIETWYEAKRQELNLPAGKGIDPLVQGRDLLALGLTPGPRFKSILAKAFTLQIEGGKYEAIMEAVREWAREADAETVRRG